MTWFKVCDTFHSNRKVITLSATELGRAAIGLWAVAGSWCADNLTDGELDLAVVKRLGWKPKHAKALVEAGLWEIREGDYRYHEWHGYQPTRQSVESKRASARERMAAKRASQPGSERAPPVRANKERTVSEVLDPYPSRPVPIPTHTPPEPLRPSWVCVIRISEESAPWLAGCQSVAHQKPHAKAIWQACGESEERVKDLVERWSEDEWVQKNQAGLSHLAAQMHRYSSSKVISKMSADEKSRLNRELETLRKMSEDGLQVVGQIRELERRLEAG